MHNLRELFSAIGERHRKNAMHSAPDAKPARCLWSVSIATASFCAALVTSGIASDAIYTRTDGVTCQRAVIDGAQKTQCRGPAGYLAVIVQRDRVMKIDFRLTTAPCSGGGTAGSYVGTDRDTHRRPDRMAQRAGAAICGNCTDIHLGGIRHA